MKKPMITKRNLIENFLKKGILLLAFGWMLFAFREEAQAAEIVVDNSSYYTVVGNTIHVNTQSGDAMVGPKIDSALAYAKDHATSSNRMTVKVPAGSYTLSSQNMPMTMYGVESKKNIKFTGLHIYSNTTLDVTDCTIKMGSNMKNMLLFGNFFAKTEGSSKAVPYKGVDNYNYTAHNSGYSGYENITVIGGTWIGNTGTNNTMMKLYHATNVKLQGVTLQKGGGKHQIEVGGVNKLYVENCTFEKHQLNVSGAEALQLDVPCDSAVMQTGYNDGTANCNVFITGCTFSKLDIGVASHTNLLGSYQRNINIKDNTFKNITNQAISTLCYENLTITGNIIEKCGAGIWVRSFLPLEKNMVSDITYSTVLDGQQHFTQGGFTFNANTRIQDNVISLKAPVYVGDAIYVAGKNLTYKVYDAKGNVVPKNDYYMNGVTIKHNIINTPGSGIVCEDTRDLNIEKNEIYGKSSYCSYGIRVGSNSQINCIKNNLLQNLGPYASAIYINKSTFTGKGNIQKNTVNHTSKKKYACKYGIRITNKSNLKFASVRDNKISDSVSHGIYIGKSSAYTMIQGNKIENAGGNGIYITNVVDQSAIIQDNELLNCYDNGIKIYGPKSKATTGVLKNTIKSKKKQKAAVLISGTRYSVRNNKIYKFKYGIKTSKTAKGNVKNNKFYGVKKKVKLKAF